MNCEGHLEHNRDGERTLFLAFFAVEPPTGGASQVSYQLARHWPGERVLVQIGDHVGASEVEPDLTIARLGFRGESERWAKLLSVPRWCRAMCAIATEFDPDTIVLEGASWCAYHWWLIGGLRRAAPAARIMYHAHNVEYDLRRQKHSCVVAWLTRRAERAVLRQVDAATAVSEVDADRFCALYGRRPLLLPNGVDLAWLRDTSEKAVEAVRRRYVLPPATVLFMGGYAYRPNGEAIDFLVRDVFPELVRRAPSAKLLVLGGEVPYSAPWLVAPGVVPAVELPAFIRAAAVSVVPIFSGSGTRLKVVESLAAGVPVIATEKGVEGLPLQPGRDFVRAETAAEFIDAVIARLVEGEAASAAPSGDALIRFSWPTIVAQIRANLGMGGRRAISMQMHPSELSRFLSRVLSAVASVHPSLYKINTWSLMLDYANPFANYVELNRNSGGAWGLRNVIFHLDPDIRELFARYGRFQRAQLLQDLAYIKHFRKVTESGFFVEVGAGDGVHLSNTYLFENEFGWSGLLVEPNPQFHASIRRSRAAKLDIRAACASEVAEAAFQVSGELSHLNEIRALDRHKRNGEVIRVPAATLTRILDEAGAPTHIDFMSIDTEGAELEVLKGLDLQRYRIDFICVEHNFVVAKRTEIQRFLNDVGYCCVSNAASLWDDWFVDGSRALLL